MRNIMTRKQRSLLIAGAVFGITASAWAETVYVKLRSGTIRSGTDATLEPVADVKQGDKLDVIGHEGSWLKVSVGGKQGYIQQNSISDKPVGGKGGSLSQGSANITASAGGASLAGRGLGDDAAKWSQSKNLNVAGLERMLAQNEVIRHKSGNLLGEFVKAGNVGPAKK
jgi:uncharacterized protein YgiM (DUF1202 family)